MDPSEPLDRLQLDHHRAADDKIELDAAVGLGHGNTQLMT